MIKPLMAAIFAAAIIGMIGNSAFANSQIVNVEPNDGPLYYQVHYLKAGEKPSYFNYQCWGCSGNDFLKIFEETGLWNYDNLGWP